MSRRPLPGRGRVGRLLDAVLDLLPGPPSPETREPLVDGLDALPPKQRTARMRVLLGKHRRGRGDGWDG
jgi:hypothetical protein